MDSANPTQEIVICLGSSCFARGNCDHLATIKAYIESHDLNASVLLSGVLCQDQCKLGPNLSVNGQLHHGVTAEQMLDLLKQLHSPQGVTDGKD